jgi:pyruvate formate lyase activating enzyme
MKIKAIRKIKKPVRVYNFSVPKYETYIANGVAVHNCQNFKVSQTTEGPNLYKSPQELMSLAEQKASGIAFTFNEPTLYYEYIREVSGGVDVVMKTNGFVNTAILDELSGVSAWNVDIKGDDDEYQRICHGRLDPVLDSIAYLSNRSHLEISYLVLPRMIANMGFHRRIRDFLADINPAIPVHILYFYPFHKMIEHAYAPKDLVPIISLFKERLQYTYVSNAFHSELIGYRHTYCSSCNDMLVERLRGVRVLKSECCGEVRFFQG